MLVGTQKMHLAQTVYSRHTSHRIQVCIKIFTDAFLIKSTIKGSNVLCASTDIT